MFSLGQLFLLLATFPSSISTTSSTTTDPSQKRRLKILVFSVVPAHSHMQFMGTIADSLAEAGHEVHFVKTIADHFDWVPRGKAAPSEETKLSSKVYRVEFSQQAANESPVASQSILYSFSGHTAWPMLNAWDNSFARIFDLWPYFCKGAIHSFALSDSKKCLEFIFRHELLAEMEKEHYDVAIYELFDLCGAAIFERIGVRTKLATVAVPMPQMSAVHFGIPTFASFVPNWAYLPPNAPTMDFWGRLINFCNAFYDWYQLNDRLTEMETPLIREAFGADFPPLKQLAKNISLFFINANQFLEFARPISNKIVYIGGITDEGKKVAELDEKFRTILDNSRAGTVLFSFGTVANTRTLGESVRRTLLRTLGKLRDFEFIWKLDDESSANESALIDGTPNVHTFEWIPQNAILSHPKTRAFITHCGKNSLAEAAKFGVPIVAIPLFADQLYNAMLATHRGIGVHVDIGQLIADETGEVLITALNRILHDNSFRANAKIIQKKIALSPFGAKEQLVRWVEFAAKFPPLNELNLPTDDELGWIVYYSVDVILFITLAAFLSILAPFLMIRMAFGQLFKRRIRRMKAQKKLKGE